MTKMLTDTAVRKAKPATELADHSCAGLRLRVSPEGRRTFFYRWRDGDKLRKLTLGVYPSMSLLEAREAWSALAKIRRAGGDPRAAVASNQARQRAENREVLRQQQNDAFTVRVLARKYLDFASDAITTRDWKDRSRYLGQLVEKYGDLPARKLGKPEVQSVAKQYRKRGKISAANRYLAAVKAAWNWAIDESLPSSKDPLTGNPAARIRHEGETPRQRALNNVEIRTVLQNLPACGITEREADFFRFVLATGCRIGEATAMRWEDLFGGREWRQPTSKNRRQHIVYLSNFAAACVDRQERIGPYVWANPVTRITRPSKAIFQDHLSKAIPRLGVEKFTALDLRRSMVTWLGDQQPDSRVIDRMTDHTPEKPERTHNTASYNQPAREWWERWGEHLQALSVENVVSLDRKRK